MVVPTFRNNLWRTLALPALVEVVPLHADSWQCSAPNSTQSFVGAALYAAECLRSSYVCVLLGGGRNQAKFAKLIKFWLGEPLQHGDCCIWH